MPGKLNTTQNPTIPEVSVIICTYEPNEKKLFATIDSVISQHDVTFEIIICDDGSTVFYEKEIKEYFMHKKFADYIISQSKNNEGTVKNVLRGTRLANSEYVYCLSPGDMFFSKSLLCEYLNFVKTNDADICFAQVMDYTIVSNDVRIINLKGSLNTIFRPNVKNILLQQIVWVRFARAVGASFLRRRDVFLQYLEKISGICIYLEDWPTSSIHLFSGKPVFYFDKYAVWYEYGTGVSTSNNSYYTNALRNDAKRAWQLLREDYKSNPVVDASAQNKTKRLLKHPCISVVWGFCKLANSFSRLERKTYSAKDIEYLKDLLDR